MTLKSFIIRATTLLVLFAAAIYAIIVLSLGRANAMPDPYTPIPPAYCAGGGGQTPWGGYCDGKTFPDGTKLHIANAMGFWQPMQCIIADGGTTPASPGGCGGFV